MSVQHHVVRDLYKDSVALMVISSKLLAIDGIDGASVVMATPVNLDNLASAGLGRPDSRPADVVVAVSGTDAACTGALALAEELLREPATARDPDGAVVVPPPPSIQAALERSPHAQLALISVPGEYAAAEARKALRLGLHVMLFSDNVPVQHERELKELASARGLLLMGPDCGTAILNGFPLGFANVVRRGTIGVVGASGTGTQEITSRIHNLGAGVSQAIGTGGHDLAAEIGGITMRQGLRMLAADPGTEVIVLASKPPSAAVAGALLAEVRAIAKPVVVVFLGADPATIPPPLVAAATLADAADLAVALSRGRVPSPPATDLPTDTVVAIDAAAARLGPRRRNVRGVFCGGTFCYEAQLVLRDAGIVAASNTPIAGNRSLTDVHVSEGHTVVDMGDDVFTQGRPHPMIDPRLRDERLAREAGDPDTAVLLFDVVLGHGATDDPVQGLCTVLAGARARAAATGGPVVAVGHVCGTDADPQDRARCVAALQDVGVIVASSNAEAARAAARVVHGAGR